MNNDRHLGLIWPTTARRNRRCHLEPQRSFVRNAWRGTIRLGCLGAALTVPSAISFSQDVTGSSAWDEIATDWTPSPGGFTFGPPPLPKAPPAKPMTSRSDTASRSQPIGSGLVQPTIEFGDPEPNYPQVARSLTLAAPFEDPALTPETPAPSPSYPSASPPSGQDDVPAAEPTEMDWAQPSTDEPAPEQATPPSELAPSDSPWETESAWESVPDSLTAPSSGPQSVLVTPPAVARPEAVTFRSLPPRPQTRSASSDETALEINENNALVPNTRPTINVRPASAYSSKRKLNVPLRNAYAIPGDDAQLGAVVSEAERRVAAGRSLAERGATWSARLEFLAALRLIAEAFDVAANSTAHTDSLTLALTAMEEAEDFVPTGGSGLTEQDVKDLLRVHRSPVPKPPEATSTSALVAIGAYYSFTSEHLALAAGHSQVAGSALYHLGKLQSHLQTDQARQVHVINPRAMAMYQAALTAHPDHHLAANELGVLLARSGEVDAAIGALRVSLQTRPSPEAWHNLAVIHDRRGEGDLAELARVELARLSQGEDFEARQRLAAMPPVEWLPPSRFAERSGPDAGNVSR